MGTSRIMERIECALEKESRVETTMHHAAEKKIPHKLHESKRQNNPFNPIRSMDEQEGEHRKQKASRLDLSLSPARAGRTKEEVTAERAGHAAAMTEGRSEERKEAERFHSLSKVKSGLGSRRSCTNV